jgi:4a-hydroxytetrahydrobiopterin dehydratase
MTQHLIKRQQLSDAVSGLGWRYILGNLRTQVLVSSLEQGIVVAARAIAVADEEADDHLRLDVRPDRVLIQLQDRAETRATGRDIELATAITAALGALGLVTTAGVDDEGHRSVQGVEIGIDAMDIPAIRPFWLAALGYTPENEAPDGGLVDPSGQGPAIWFQQMDAPRPQRNRLHFDVTIPHDEAQRRMDAMLAAGGRLTYDAEAPAFWVFADPEGNEICICTWQGRDERDAGSAPAR